jgi:hypothetical protein
VQMDSSFPFGTCINTNVIQNPAFVDFSPSTSTGAAQVVPHGGAAGAAQLRLRRAFRLL